MYRLGQYLILTAARTLSLMPVSTKTAGDDLQNCTDLAHFKSRRRSQRFDRFKPTLRLLSSEKMRLKRNAEQ